MYPTDKVVIPGILEGLHRLRHTPDNKVFVESINQGFVDEIVDGSLTLESFTKGGHDVLSESVGNIEFLQVHGIHVDRCHEANGSRTQIP